MVAQTAEWLQKHQFSTPAELAAYGPLLHWKTGPGGPRSPPVLHIAIGHAVNECRGPAAARFANAIVSQLQVGRRAAAGSHTVRTQSHYSGAA